MDPETRGGEPSSDAAGYDRPETSNQAAAPSAETPDIGAPPSEAPPSSVERAPWYRRRRGQLLGGLGILGGLTAGKYVLALLTATALGTAVTAAFGSQWDRLPSETRRSYEDRLGAVYGSELDNLSDDQRAKRINSDISKGLPRLEDVQLVEAEHLITQALQATSTTTCTELAHAAFASHEPTDQTYRNLIQALDEAAFARLVEIDISAVEAQGRGSPAPRGVTSAESDAALNLVAQRMSQGDLQAFIDASEGKPVTDGQACQAMRGLFRAAESMDPATLATFARYEFSP